MSRYLPILLALFLVTALATSCSTTSKTSSETSAAKAAPAFVDSEQIPVMGSYFLGPEDAPITIVTFSSMQCPYCGRLAKTLEALLEHNPDVKVVFKHFPLPSQEQAGTASLAMLAAGEQGHFWEMHDAIFANLEYLRQDPAGLFGAIAREYGLDAKRLAADIEREDFVKIIVADLELGRDLGVRGTPASFVNGVFVPGAQPPAVFQQILNQQRELIKYLENEEGIPRPELYRTATAANIEAGLHLPEPPPKAEREADVPVVLIPVADDDPAKGNLDAPLVTIVEFSSYPCPFCARSQETLKALENLYPGELRFVFKQYPLSFQQNADLAALAARAAYEQGKFWEVHAWMFANQKNIHMIGAHLEELGIDQEKFQESLNDSAIAERVGADIQLGQQHGVRGTPAFFINGIRLVGAQPIETFQAVIDSQLDVARRLRDDEGLKGEALYQALVQYNLEQFAN
jgi:protein-disulfide isomerase